MQVGVPRVNRRQHSSHVRSSQIIVAIALAACGGDNDETARRENVALRWIKSPFQLTQPAGSPTCPYVRRRVGIRLVADLAAMAPPDPAIVTRRRSAFRAPHGS
jgi:hypothetical protein